VILCSNTPQALDLASHVMAHREGITLVSLMEHHSNDLPHRSRGKVVHFGVKDDGTLDYDDLEAKLRQHPVKLVAVTGASNVTGYLPDVHGIARLAHAHGARILIDGTRPSTCCPTPTRAISTSSRERATRPTRLSARRSCSGRSSCSTRRLPTSPRAAPSST
jgi:selenocysteine lyase/cysteine desulfurase